MTQSTLKLLPPIPPRIVEAPKTVVCPTCKEETGLTPEKIIEMTIDEHICCPVCSHVVYSCLPERPTYTQTTCGHYGDFGD